MKDGDVLLLTDGRLMKVLETKTAIGMTCVQYVDSDNFSYVSADDLDIGHNLGQGPIILAHFHGLHSIHVRFNRLGRV